MNTKVNLSRPTRSLDELHLDSRSLQYEVEMLVSIAVDFGRPQIQSSRTAQSAFAESFAIHCRALMAFFFSHAEKVTASTGLRTMGFRSPDQTDVLALDFYPTWGKHCPTPTDVLIDAKWEADKRVAHITTDRRGVNEPGSPITSVWKLDKVTTELCSILKTFLKHVPPAHFDPTAMQRIQEAIQQWQQYMAPSSSSGGGEMPKFTQARTAP